MPISTASPVRQGVRVEVSFLIDPIVTIAVQAPAKSLRNPGDAREGLKLIGWSDDKKVLARHRFGLG